VALAVWCALVALVRPTQAQVTKTIQVDCAKGQTINKALRVPAEELIIEISGICEEDVEINRENVILRGSDPALDGISGTATGYVPGIAVLTVRNVVRFRVENLAVLDGVGSGMRFSSTLAAEVVNCRVEGNAVAGIQAPHGQVFVTDTTVTGSAWGVMGFDSTYLECVRCTVTGNNFMGVGAYSDARVQVSDSEISSPIGLYSAEASQLWVDDSTVEGTSQGISVIDGGQVTISGSEVSGPISVESNGLVLFDDTDQIANSAGLNSLTVDATMELTSGSSLLGDTSIDGFSKLLVRDTSALNGNLACSAGGDAYCDRPANVTGTSTCGLCPSP